MNLHLYIWHLLCGIIESSNHIMSRAITMDFFGRVGLFLICFSLIAGVKFLSEITSSVTQLNSRLATIVERLEANETKINDIETYLFE